MKRNAVVDKEKPYKIPQFTHPESFPSTTSELFTRTRVDNPRTVNLKRKMGILMETLSNDSLRGIVSRRISAGEMLEKEMREFFDGISGILEFGEQIEIDEMRSFLGSPEFRIRGNAHLLKFLREHDVIGHEKIKVEILRCLNGGA